MSNNAKKYLEIQKTPTKHVLRLFKNFLKIRFSAQKSGSRPRCRTMLKILWNTQKTPTKHALRHFKNFLKLRFLAEKSGSRLRCRIMLKIPWNSQKTPTKHVWGFLRNSWKSGSLLKNPVPRYGAFDLGLAVSVPLPIVTGIFVLLWFQSRLTQSCKEIVCNIFIHRWSGDYYFCTWIISLAVL